MPRLKNSTPKYRHHKATGQAIVTLDGQDFYLGPWGQKPEAARKLVDILVLIAPCSRFSADVALFWRQMRAGINEPTPPAHAGVARRH